MYLPTSEACNAPNGLQTPTAELAAAASATAADTAAIKSANAAWNSILTRAPEDFYGISPMLAKDVADTNEATGVTRGGYGKSGASGINNSGPGGDCDLSGGGCEVVPLNGPGSSTAPILPNAQPVPLRTAPIQPGLGRYRARRRRGLGECSDLATWGDAFPSGGPVESPVQSLLNWTAANPLLAVGIGLAGVWMLHESQKQKGRRG